MLCSDLCGWVRAGINTIQHTDGNVHVLSLTACAFTLRGCKEFVQVAVVVTKICAGIVLQSSCLVSLGSECESLVQRLLLGLSVTPSYPMISEAVLS